MTNREAIEWFENRIAVMPESETKEMFRMAIAALEKQEQDRWIPVTERMPEIKHHIDDEHFSDEVLVTEWFNGFKKTRIGNFDTRTGWWNDEKGCGFLGVITSWRPLPEPYTEEES